MKRKSIMHSVAVGLVFTAGGHQLVLETAGSAQAAPPVETQATVAGDGECGLEPASGCIQFLSAAHPSQITFGTTRHTGVTFGQQTDDSGNGASGFVWLHAGSPMS